MRQFQRCQACTCKDKNLHRLIATRLSREVDKEAVLGSHAITLTHVPFFIFNIFLSHLQASFCLLVCVCECLYTVSTCLFLNCPAHDYLLNGLGLSSLPGLLLLRSRAFQGFSVWDDKLVAARICNPSCSSCLLPDQQCGWCPNHFQPPHCVPTTPFSCCNFKAHMLHQVINVMKFTWQPFKRFPSSGLQQHSQGNLLLHA
jgi:hypothetical protein